MYESTVERNFRKGVEARGGAAYKFVSPGHRGVPDRLVLLPVDPQHVEIVARYVWFAELKAPGKKTTVQQKREHNRLRKLGFKVEVIDK